LTLVVVSMKPILDFDKESYIRFTSKDTFEKKFKKWNRFSVSLKRYH